MVQLLWIALTAMPILSLADAGGAVLQPTGPPLSTTLGHLWSAEPNTDYGLGKGHLLFSNQSAFVASLNWSWP